jgi:hypothetical protein
MGRPWRYALSQPTRVLFLELISPAAADCNRGQTINCGVE